MRHPFLVGEKVYLRALEHSDLEGPMFDWAHDPEVNKYMYMGWVPNTSQALEREFNLLSDNGTASLLQLPEHPSDWIFAIVERGTDTHVGNIGLFGISWHMQVADVRIVVGDRKYWGQGIGFESYRLIINYGFDRLNLRRVVAGTRADNHRSSSLLRKMGFVLEGCQREHFLRNGQAYDIELYGLLRSEFFAVFPQLSPKEG